MDDNAAKSDARRICPVYEQCGACTALHVPYAEQLAEKDARIRRLFADVAGEGCALRPILGMDEPFGYRDKIVSPFAPARRKRGGKGGRPAAGKAGPASRILCGMYAAGTHRIVPIERCPVENPAGRRVVRAVRQIMARYGMEPYDEDAGRGFVRHVVVRVGHESGEVLVTLVTNGAAFPASRNFARQLVRACPEVTSIVQNVNTQATNAIFGREEQVLFGPGFILDGLCGLSVRISSQAFYQVNSTQTEVLYRTAVGLAALDGEGGRARDGAPIRVLDAYCGTGTIGLVAAAQAENVQLVGVDKVDAAIRDARQNAAHNGIDRARFEVADAGGFMRRAAREGDAFDVLFLDPPRAGASEDFLDAACTLAPGRIVYISCNPETQVRDAQRLAQGGYRLRVVQPVDMFPHTGHIECVCLFVRG